MKKSNSEISKKQKSQKPQTNVPSPEDLSALEGKLFVAVCRNPEAPVDQPAFKWALETLSVEDGHLVRRRVCTGSYARIKGALRKLLRAMAKVVMRSDNGAMR